MKLAITIFLVAQAIGVLHGAEFKRAKRRTPIVAELYDFTSVWLRLKNIESNLLNEHLKNLRAGCSNSSPFSKPTKIQDGPSDGGAHSGHHKEPFLAVDPTEPPHPTETVILGRSKRRSVPIPSPPGPPSYCVGPIGKPGPPGFPGIDGLGGFPGIPGIDGLTENTVRDIILEYTKTRCAVN